MSNVKFKACIRWMSGLLKGRLSSYNDEENLAPLQVIENRDQKIDPDITRYLSSPPIYWDVYHCILKSEEPHPKDHHQSFWPLIHALARQGIYLTKEDETSVNHTLLASMSPFDKKAHCSLMEGLMQCYVATLAPINKVVKEIRLSFGLSASKELPFTTEEALLLWVNKASRAAFTRHQRLCQEILQEENPIKKREARLRLAREGGAKVEPCHKATSIGDLSDGQCVAATLIYYKLGDIGWKDFHFSRQLLSPEFSLSNLRAIHLYCSNFLSESGLHVPPEDWMLHPQELQTNILSCLALLFDSLTKMKTEEAKKPPLGSFMTRLPRKVIANGPFKMKVSSTSDPGFNFSQKLNSTFTSHSLMSNHTSNLSSISFTSSTEGGLSQPGSVRSANTPNQSLQSFSLPSIQNPQNNNNYDDRNHNGSEIKAHGSVDSGMEMGIVVNGTSSGRTEDESSTSGGGGEQSNRDLKEVEERERNEECGEEVPEQEVKEEPQPLPSEDHLSVKVFPEKSVSSPAGEIFETNTDALLLRIKVRSKMREIRSKLDEKTRLENSRIEQIKKQVLLPDSAARCGSLPEEEGGREVGGPGPEEKRTTKEDSKVTAAMRENEQRKRRKDEIRAKLEERDRERRNAASERKSTANERRKQTRPTVVMQQRVESPQRSRRSNSAVSRTILLDNPTGRASAGQNKSNKKLIRNALCFICLAGEANITLKQKALAELEASTCYHFYILFRDTLGLKFKGLYTLPPGENKISRIFGTGPKSIEEAMVKQFFKYNSGTKSFQATVAYSFSISMDAITIQDHCWSSANKRRLKLS